MSLAVAEGIAPADPAAAEASRPARSGCARPRLWTEVLAIGWLLWLYDTVNDHAPLRLHVALSHAASIYHLERVLWLAPESPINSWIGSHPTLGAILSNYYDNAHFAVTLGLVVWLWWRHPRYYRPLRNMLVLTNAIGFVVFWLYPVAPPRMLAGSGFVDVVALTHTWGAWHSGALASQANELAAMPSLHMAWALWCGLALWFVARRWPLKALAVAYPLLTVVAVLGTANHFFLDVVGGVLTALVAGAVAFAISRVRPLQRLLRRRGTVAAVSG